MLLILTGTGGTLQKTDLARSLSKRFASEKKSEGLFLLINHFQLLGSRVMQSSFSIIILRDTDEHTIEENLAISCFWDMFVYR